MSEDLRVGAVTLHGITRTRCSPSNRLLGVTSASAPTVGTHCPAHSARGIGPPTLSFGRCPGQGEGAGVT